MKKIISLTVLTVALIGCFPEVAAPSLSRSMRMEAKASIVYTDARPHQKSEPIERLEPADSELDKHVFTRPEEFPAVEEGPSKLELQYASWRKDCVEQFGAPLATPSFSTLRVGLVSGHLEVHNPDELTAKFLKDMATEANRDLPIDPKFLALFEYQRTGDVVRSDPLAFRFYAGDEVFAGTRLGTFKLVDGKMQYFPTNGHDQAPRLGSDKMWLIEQALIGDKEVLKRIAEYLEKPFSYDPRTETWYEYHPESQEVAFFHHEHVFEMKERFHWKLDLVRDWAWYSPEYRASSAPTGKSMLQQSIFGDDLPESVESVAVPSFRSGQLLITTKTLNSLDPNAFLASLFSRARRAGADGQLQFIPDVVELRDDEGHRLGCLAYNQ